MKKILLFLTIILFISCKTTYPNEKKLSYTAPVKIGDDWSKKKVEMGSPDKSGDNFCSYFSKGMIVYYDGSVVNKLVFSWFKGSLHFTGEVYGIKIGDTYPKLVRLWGEPTESGIPQEEYYEKMWVFKKFGIIVQFWSHAGNNEDLGGRYEQDTVKRIQITSDK